MAYVVERTSKSPAPPATWLLPRPRGPDPLGRHPRATRRAAERAAHREEQKVLAGSWRDASLGAVSFHDYVETDWLPSKHIEPTTMAAYASNLNKHFYPFLGRKPMYQIPRPWSRTGSPKPPPAGCRPARSASTTPCCTRSSNVRSATSHRVQPLRAHRAPQGHRAQIPHPHPDRVRPVGPRDPRPAPAPDRDRDRDRHALGRAHRAPAPAHRLPQKVVTVEETIIEVSTSTPPPASATSPSPTPRTTNPAPSGSTTTGSRQSRTTQHPHHRSRRPALHHQRGHPDLTQHLPHPRLAPRRQGQRHRLPRPHARPPPRPRLLATRRRIRPS